MGKLISYINFFLYIKMLAIKKAKNGFKKSFMKGFKIFLRKKKLKNISMLVNDLDIILKWRKTKSENMVANVIKIFLKMKNKRWLSIGKIIVNCRKIKTEIYKTIFQINEKVFQSFLF